MTRFLFVIDTDSYSGNFNREMCAYLTSQWDQATHGGKQAAIAEKEIPNPIGSGSCMKFRRPFAVLLGALDRQPSLIKISDLQKDSNCLPHSGH